MKYIIEFSEKKKTSTGKIKVDATLKDEQGVLHDRVTIWGDFVGFDSLMTGHTVEGTLTPAKDPKFGPTLYAPRATTSPYAARSGNKSAAMEKVMEKKQEGIREAQGAKENGIKIASTLRMAVDIITSYMDKDSSEDFIKSKISQWREWLWNEWDKEDKDFPPFND